MLILLEDLNQARQRPLACLVRQYFVRVLADLPELVQVEVLAGIDLTGRVLVRVLAFAAKEILNARRR